MKNPLLSILICTLPSRVHTFLPEIVQKVNAQTVGKDVELLYLGDNRSMSVGEKRNKLVDISKGDYVCFIDDDDEISDNYVDAILEALKSRPDVVTINGVIDRNGNSQLIYNFTKDAGGNFNKQGVAHRLPNHLCAHKRAHMEQVRFQHINLNEDNKFSQKVSNLISLEVKAENAYYYYNFRSETTETQEHNIVRRSR